MNDVPGTSWFAITPIWRRWATLVLAAFAAAGCEAIPVVHFSVVSTSNACDPVYWKGAPSDLPWTVEGLVPLENALVIICDPEVECTAPSDVALAALRDDRVGTTGDKGPDQPHQWPVVMRTDARGAAKYSELRLSPLFFVPFPPLQRRVHVRAEGHQPREVTIEIGTVTHSLVVPLRRER